MQQDQVVLQKYGMIFEKIDLESDIDIDAVLTLARRGPDGGGSPTFRSTGKICMRAPHIDECL